MLAGLVCAVVDIAVILLGIGRHVGYNVAAALLTLVTALFGYRAFDLSTHRRLREIQRVQLLERIRRLRALQIRIAAVPDREAVNFARELLDVFLAAGWRAQGVYRTSHGNVGRTGLFLAVKDDDSAPDEARWLLLLLDEVGLEASQATKAALPVGVLELVVGRRPM